MKNDEQERKNNENRLNIWKKTVKNDEKKSGNTNKETWWNIEKNRIWWKKTKQQWRMMKKGEKTMKNYEKNKKQWKMMKHRETTMNHDEKLKKKTMKNDEK